MVKVAVVQASPILFDRASTVTKTCKLVREASGNGAKVILFPEAFIPAYPRGLSFGMVVGSRTSAGRKTWERYYKNSVEIPGIECKELADVAMETGTYVAIGVIEKDNTFSKGTLFCTLLYLGPDGTVLGKHRKLKPTAAERLIWGEGDGSTLIAIDSEYGRIGGLICWENYMPLARTAMYGKGVEIYLAPTADQRDGWQSTLRHIALEGRCYVLGCNQFVTKEMYPRDLEGIEEITNLPDIICRGGSVIISPLGEILAGPIWDKEGIIYADIDRESIIRSKLDFDVVGHYSRPDVFQLIVNENPTPSVTYKR